MFKGLIFILLLFGNAVNTFSQDVQFSQLFADRIYLNPAYAGADYCPKFALSYRNQWPGIQFPYVTYSASFDKYVAALNGGLGIRIMKDDQGGGVFNQLNLDFIYSYHVNLSKKLAAKFALEASIYQKNMNVRDLVFYNMIDPVQGIIYPNSEAIADENFLSPDFSAGILLNYRNYFFGFSASHLPQTIVEHHNEYLPAKFTAHIGAAIPILKNGMVESNYILEPNVVYINQQNMNMLYYGIYFDINDMTVGLFYRQNLNFHFDAMVFSYHLKIKNLMIAYSYDLTLSKFIRQTLGSHEISLGYLLSCDKKNRKYNTISCPSF
ncbi:MAG: PorP/SprF family type IX secretion system membrane protein [Bacteroidales bacterium]|nr:PorP/SprF family type IX secretion system membrane protein [Bacteroidales bacterium]